MIAKVSICAVLIEEEKFWNSCNESYNLLSLVLEVQWFGQRACITVIGLELA